MAETALSAPSSHGKTTPRSPTPLPGNLRTLQVPSSLTSHTPPLTWSTTAPRRSPRHAPTSAVDDDVRYLAHALPLSSVITHSRSISLSPIAPASRQVTPSVRQSPTLARVDVVSPRHRSPRHVAMRLATYIRPPRRRPEMHARAARRVSIHLPPARV